MSSYGHSGDSREILRSSIPTRPAEQRRWTFTEGGPMGPDQPSRELPAASSSRLPEGRHTQHSPERLAAYGSELSRNFGTVVETRPHDRLNAYFRSNDCSYEAIVALGREFINRIYRPTSEPVPPITEDQYNLLIDPLNNVRLDPLNNVRSAYISKSPLELAREGYEKGQQLKARQYAAFERLRGTTIKETLDRMKNVVGSAKRYSREKWLIDQLPESRKDAVDIERIQKIVRILDPSRNNNFIAYYFTDSDPKSPNNNKSELLNELFGILPGRIALCDKIKELEQKLDGEHM